MKKSYSENTNLAEIPAEAFDFNFIGEVAFAEDGAENNNIRLKLYDGSIINHWYWGNMAFDIKGMKLARPRIPILYSHDRDSRVGYSTKATFEDDFVLDGKMLKNSEQAQRIKADYKDGFPFEASLSFDPGDVTLRYVKEGETAEVNDQQLKGPGTVLLKTKIKEASVCVFGMQKNCKTTIFGREKIKAPDSETLASFAQQQPELYDLALEEGRKMERDFFAGFADRFKEAPGFCVGQYLEGKTLDEAVAAYPSHKAKIDPAQQEFSDIQQRPKDEAPTDFEAAVKQCMEKEKCTEPEAIRRTVGKFPALYDAYTKKLQEQTV